ncbi:hypothetical protein [Cloacibacterium normanense]|uniref:hypothetical protein n=1 Tax=Cloacibacterium normanense TaxID=237258 RepID=UPI00391AFC3D
MKKLYLPLLLAISFVSKAQILDSTKVENAKVYSLKIANPIVNKPLFFKETQNEGNDIQKNLNQLNSRFTVNPYQIPKTLINPNGSATPKQAIISGLLKGMTR